MGSSHDDGKNCPTFAFDGTPFAIPKSNDAQNESNRCRKKQYSKQTNISSGNCPARRV
jgi:hypothetical protein